jgi:ABC-type glycerol-3-phosphate transport system permease component
MLALEPDLVMVPLGLNYLITGDVFLWGPIMAGAVFSSVPVVTLYLLAQKFMVQGMTSGSVKG